MTLKRIEQFDPPRDSYGRPRIGGRTYQRASTRAKMLSDMSRLPDWARKDTIRRLQEDPALLGLDPADLFDVMTVNDGATYGKIVHGLVEAYYLGDAGPAEAEADHVRDSQAVIDAIEALDMVVLTSELLVVCDKLGVAGTLDLLVRSPDGAAHVADIKTMRSPDGWKYRGLEYAVQTACYAHGLPVDASGKVVSWDDVGLPEPDKIEALILVVEQRAANVLALVADIDMGFQTAQLAAEVQAIRGDARFAVPL